jgi:hyperosmotically inducible periplasmic protein
MRRTSWMKRGALAVSLSAVLAFPVHAAAPDAWITTKAKFALLTTEGVSGTAVHVDTLGGQVTLHGKVPSAEEKANAEAAVKKIDGVKSVRNLLQVVAAKQEEAVQVTNDALEERITKKLDADPSLESSSISVKSVNKGVVLLSGTAKTLTAHLRAIEEVAAMPGVRRVASEVQSPDTLADAEIWREPAAKGKEPSEKYGMGEAARDLWITSATKMSLLADSRTPALDINVDSREGVVTLFGIVSSPEAKAAAEEDALGVSGVERVENELEVVASAKQEAMEVRDEEVAGAVEKAFESHELPDVTVEVKNGVVRLSGTVPTGSRRLEAAVAARAVPGVRSIQDDLRLAAVEE